MRNSFFSKDGYSQSTFLAPRSLPRPPLPPFHASRFSPESSSLAILSLHSMIAKCEKIEGCE